MGNALTNFQPGNINASGDWGELHAGNLRALGKMNEVPREFMPILDSMTASTLFNLGIGQDTLGQFPLGSFFDPQAVEGMVSMRDRGQMALGESGMRAGVPAFQSGLRGLQEGVSTGFVDPSVIGQFGEQLQGLADFQFERATPDILEAGAVTGDLRGSNVFESLARAREGIQQSTVAAPTAQLTQTLAPIQAQNRLAASSLASQLPQTLSPLFGGPAGAALGDVRTRMGFPAVGTQAAGGTGGIPFAMGQGPTALAAVAPIMAAAMGGKCHIAEQVYGDDDPRVEIARHMIHTKKVHGEDFSVLYNTTAEHVAPHFNPASLIPFFDAMIEEAVHG